MRINSLAIKKSFLGSSFGFLLLASSCFSVSAYAQAGNGVDPLAFGGASVDHIPTQPVAAYNGMVVSASDLAAKVGAQVLKDGGNAVDAAVAVAYAMAVTYPAAGNIGGGGFLTLRLPNGEAYFVDFREKAPHMATANMFLDKQGKVIPNASILGWKSVGVPGTVAGMELIRERWGTKSRVDLMNPAIKLAKDGYVLTKEDIALLSTSTSDFAKDPDAAQIFLKPDGTPWQVGDVFRQTDLAKTLALIAKKGNSAFYKGKIAKQIVAASVKNGGILTMQDFAAYQPRVMKPLTCSYRGYKIDTAPPPSGGGVALCEILNITSGYDMHKLGLHSLPSVQRQVEAMRRAYSDRRDLGDPAFVKNDIERFLSAQYAADIRKNLNFKHAVNSAQLVPGQVALAPTPKMGVQASHEKNETTHFSIIDKNGMAISMTYTLNGWFGARVVAGQTGIVMNDEMDDFSTAPGQPNMYGIVGSKANAIAPGKTPLSSMTPTIISKDNQPFMVIGSPGGSRIPTIILSVVTGVIDYDLNIQQAINLPRFHQQWEPVPVQLESNALSPQVREGLKKKGYPLDMYSTWGIAEGIHVGKDKDGKRVYYGGVDYRHAGGAAVGE
ncbi:gamma-glutamyltransferase [Commensalibacter oyaizuii]|uniref:Glutathione hydrolase proenzyme n=1 Tax=Commensalibacter oyaizuii TaxID=3043873 RepID=A0ABT6PY94_9PROT|nr:gamma-glutamyltransferase [Commensalibacter sp. TBRC 16381]MDI2089799.1 gamma-glutamyltransferase [Commensalibacter sp. TBRC 16381]